MRRIAITDGRSGARSDQIGFAAAAQALSFRCAELAAGGVDYLLVREPSLAAERLELLVRQIVKAVSATRTGVLVAGDVHVALQVAQAAGASGIHLRGADAGELPHLRASHPELSITASCHTVEEVRAAARNGASAAVFAPVFGKWVDGHEVVAGVGLAALREACLAAEGLPVFALGGVTAANAQACVEAGAAGVAAIRMFFG